MKFPREQLEHAFKNVQDKKHWKNPINSCVRSEDVEITMEAIAFFTATEATLGENLGNGWYKISAPGYYLGPAN
jgi:hypothetical protein